MPFALSTFGRLGPESQQLFHDLTRFLKRGDASLSDSDPVRSRAQQLQLALMREVARMLLQGALPSEPDPMPEFDPAPSSALEAAYEEAQHSFSSSEVPDTETIPGATFAAPIAVAQGGAGRPASSGSGGTQELKFPGPVQQGLGDSTSRRWGRQPGTSPWHNFCGT